MLRPTKVLQGPHISAHHISVISTYQRPSEFPRLENSAQLTLKVIVHLGCSQVDDSCWLKMAVHYRKLDTNIIHGIFHVISCYLISWYGIRYAAISFPNDFHAHPEVWDWESYNTQGVWHHATRNYVNVTWVSLPQQLSPQILCQVASQHMQPLSSVMTLRMKNNTSLAVSAQFLIKKIVQQQNAVNQQEAKRNMWLLSSQHVSPLHPPWPYTFVMHLALLRQFGPSIWWGHHQYPHCRTRSQKRPHDDLRPFASTGRRRSLSIHATHRHHRALLVLQDVIQ